MVATRFLFRSLRFARRPRAAKIFCACNFFKNRFLRPLSGLKFSVAPFSVGGACLHRAGLWRILGSGLRSPA
jgi:hypothetical protein